MPPEEVKTILALIFVWPLGIYLTLRHRPRWFKRTSFIVMFVFYAYFTSWIAASIFMAPSHMAAGEKRWLEKISIEEGRNYAINVDSPDASDDSRVSGVINIQCNLQSVTPESSTEADYEGQLSSLLCEDTSLKGSYSHYSSTSLKSTGFGGELNTGGNGRYSLELALDGFTKDDWEKDDIDLEALRRDGIDKIVKLSIENRVLDSAVVAEKLVTIHYIFSESDISLLKSRSDGHKAYVVAENERRAKEEADKKAKEEAIRLGAERKKQAEQVAPAAPPVQPAPSNPTPSQPSTPTPPVESSNLPLKAICKDGTVSYQDTPSHPNYQGMCSGHGGIQTRLGRVP